METLGKTLKSLREQLGYTLREVDEATGISNAYLSQLENEKIKKPSANILYKLANVYKIDLDILLTAAGIIQQKNENEKKMSTLEKEIAFSKDEFNEEQQEEIIKFIKYLRFKNKGGPPI